MIQYRETLFRPLNYNEVNLSSFVIFDSIEVHASWVRGLCVARIVSIPSATVPSFSKTRIGDRTSKDFSTIF